MGRRHREVALGSCRPSDDSPQEGSPVSRARLTRGTESAESETVDEGRCSLELRNTHLQILLRTGAWIHLAVLLVTWKVETVPIPGGKDK